MSQNNNNKPEQWGFTLTNVKFCSGDTEISRPFISSIDAPRSLSHDAIKFTWANREWTLINTPDETVNSTKKGGLFETSCLVTPFVEGDTLGNMEYEIDIITLLLSFALGRDIQCSILCLVSGDTGHERRGHVRAFNDVGPKIVDNYIAGNIKNFLESSEATVKSEYDWHRFTIALHVEGGVSKTLDIKWYIYNILIDRIVKKICNHLPPCNQERQDAKNIVDSPAFQYQLNNLFQLFPPTCKGYFKSIMLNGIRDSITLNKSFVERVKRACESEKVNTSSLAPYLKNRDGLLHTGELENILTDVEKIQYWINLQNTTTLLILRLLNFDGEIHLENSPLQEYPYTHFPLASILLP